MMKINNKMLSRVIKVILAGAALSGMFYVGTAMAVGKVTGDTIGTIASQLGSSIVSFIGIVSDISLVTGVVFVFVSFFNFHAHKNNPQQVPLSKGLVALILGAALMTFPLLIPTATKAVFGTKAGVSQVGGKGLTGIISSPSGGMKKI